MSFEEEENIKGDVVVVTGASRGMGKAVSEEFAKRGATVILGCVDIEEGEDAVNEIKAKSGNENVEMIPLDLADMISVQSFAADVKRKYPSLRILVNNAGIIAANGGRQTKTKDGINTTMAVNYFGHFLLTNLLLENLKNGKPSRVISMASTALLMAKLDITDINMDKSGFGIENSLPYSNSKHAVALFMKELGHRMKGTGVTTYSLCPGLVKTTIGDNLPPFGRAWHNSFLRIFGFTAKEAASEFILYHALSKKIAHETGMMYRFKKHFSAANEKLNANTAKDLWDVSATLVQLAERLQAHQSKNPIN